MKKFIKIAVIISKIAELLHWTTAGIFLFFSGAEIFAGSEFVKSTAFGKYFVYRENSDIFSGLEIYGLQIRCQTAFNSYNSTAMLIYSLGTVIILCLVAFAFRNIHSILKSDNPFQETAVTMLKKIGICFIGVSAVCLMTSITASNYMSCFHADFNFTSAVSGIFMLCLAEYFKYAHKLQEDSYGLI